ncbi:MAG: hypothetical protein ACTSWG_10520 [Candidatus Helarchaeota archaeon]
MSTYNNKFNPFTGMLQKVLDANSVNALTWKPSVATSDDLPALGNSKNDARLTDDTQHLYVWDGSAWQDQGDILDINWSAINGKPSSSVSDIDDAVTKKHTQNTDTKLDEGGANEVSASQAKDAYTHSEVSSGNPHSVSKSDVGLGNVPNVDATNADNIDLDVLGSPTYKSLQNLFDTTQSSGILSGGEITDAGSGQINISAVKGVIKTTNSDIGDNVCFDLDALSGVSLTDNSINYISIDYNSGSPQFVVGTSNTANGHTTFNLGKVYREATSLDIINSGLRINDNIKRLQQKFLEEDDLQVISGAVISETGTRNIALTAGIIYAGLNKITVSSFDSSGADTFEYYYYNGSNWIESDQSQIDNTNYNDNTSGLVELTSNRYGIHWVYLSSSGTVLIVYGQGDYTLAQAQSAQPLSSLPDHISETGILRGKIIIQKSASSFTEIENVADTIFQAQNPVNHNDLGGLQGGVSTEYYHLTSAEYSALHTQNTDTKLDEGGANEVSASEAKTAYTHSQVSSGNPHSVSKSDVGLGNVTNNEQVNAISSTNHAIPRFDGTSGQIQDSSVLIDDSNNITGVNQLDIDSANGVDVNPGSDTDADLLTVGVSGAPTIKWDESEDKFDLNKGINIAGTLNISNNSGIKAYNNTQQNMPSNEFIRLLLDAEDYDTLNEFDNTTKTGSADGTVANHLQDDTNSQFTEDDIGRWVWNTTDDTYTTITAFNDAGDVTLSDDIFANGENYIIYDGTFTVSEDGLYLMVVNITIAGNTNGDRIVTRLLKGPTALAQSVYYLTGTNNPSLAPIIQIKNLSAGDVIDVEINNQTNSDQTITGARDTYLQIVKIG